MLALGLPNADKIYWTLIASSSSDSASTQKCFNKLLEEERAKDVQQFGEVCPEVLELVENVCSMHLGVNLRKAFLDGIRCLTHTATESCRERYHQFCKLLGKHGVPEYGLGVLAFPDFVQQSTDPDKVGYYQICGKKLGWIDKLEVAILFQHVTLGNILLLRKAALDFLLYTGKSDGNKLEQDVYQKRLDPDMLSRLLFMH